VQDFQLLDKFCNALVYSGGSGSAVCILWFVILLPFPSVL